ncbi:MAG: KR domain-containing protein, partial [Actinomycetota bacterium]
MTAGTTIEGSTALVAGGTGGLGSRIAAELTARGARVVTVSRSGSSSGSHLVADLRSADEAERVVAE